MNRSFTAQIGVERHTNWLLNFGNVKIQLIGSLELITFDEESCTATFFGLEAAPNEWIAVGSGSLCKVSLAATTGEIKYILEAYKYLTTST